MDPLLGRDDELERLTTALRSDRWIAVLGEAGVGKTSLIRAAIGRSGRAARHGGGFATLRWMPYLALSRAVGTSVAGDSTRAAAVVEGAVGPDLLVIDDLQWVDSASLAALELLAGRIQVVGVVRRGDPGAEAATVILQRGGAELIDLGGLPEASGVALVRRIRADIGQTAAARMVRRAGGNPLLLEEMARSGETVAVMARLLEARRARLSAAGRATLNLLAVSEHPLPEASLEHGEELLDAGLATRIDGDLEIRHALLAESIRDSLGDAERRTIHERLGSIARNPAEQARHLLAAGRRTEAEAVARDALDAATDVRARTVLLTTLADATGELHDRVRAATELVTVADFATILRLTDGELPAGGEIGLEARFQRASALNRTGSADAAWTLATASLAGADERGVPAFARLATLVAILTINFKGEPQTAIEFLERQIERGGLDPYGETSLRYLREVARTFAGGTADLGLIRRAVDQAFRDQPADAAARATNLVKMVRVTEGTRPALDLALAMQRRIADVGYDLPSIELLAEAVGDATMAGDFVDAIAIADRILDRPAPLRSQINAVAWAAMAAGYLGRFDVAAARLRGHGEHRRGDRGESAELLIAELEVAYWSGESVRAIALADQLVEHGSSSPVNLCLPLLTAAWADFELGRPIRAVPNFDLAALAHVAPTVDGLRALAAGTPSAAIDLFDHAAAAASRFVATNSLQAHWAAAEACRLAGDATVAIDRLRRVETEAEAVGFRPLLARIRRSLRLAGIRTSAHRAVASVVGLSPREREIVELVGDGLNNVEIARRLGLGRPTVARMLSSAMAKLGVERRTQLAARELV